MARRAAALYTVRVALCGILCAARSVSAQPDDRSARTSFDKGAALESEAAALLKAGEREQAEALLRQALDTYRDALARSPSDPDAPLRMGTIMLFQNRCGEAVPLLERTARVAFDLDLRDRAGLRPQRVAGRPKLRELMLLVGRCRLVDGPDETGFRLLEIVGDLPPDVQFLVGRRYLNAGRHRRALTHLSAYLAGNPKDVKVLMVVANLQLRLDLLGDAALSYRKILSVRPADLDALKNLAVVEVRRGEYPQAIATFERVLQQVPNDIQARFNLGVCLARVGRHRDAIRHLQEAVRIKPRLSRAWYRLGLSLYALRRSSEAIDALRTAARHAPKHVPSYAALARIHRADGAADVCVSVIRRGLRAAGEDTRLFLGLGDCLRDAGDPAGALNAHRRAERLSPASAAVQAALGADLRILGRWDEAISAFRSALQKGIDDDGATRSSLAETLGIQGAKALRTRQTARALALLREATTLKPDAAVDHCNLGLALLLEGQRDEAERALFRAREMDPHHPIIAAAFGRVLLAAGKEKEAVPMLASAISSSADSVPLLRMLGLAHLRRGETTPATKWLRRAVALRPDDPGLRFDLGRALLRDARPDEAWQAMATMSPTPPSYVDEATYVLVRGYAAYRAQAYEAATRIFGAGPGRSPAATALRAAAWIHYGRELVGRGQHRVALSAFHTANELKRSVESTANAAAVEYELGQPLRAYKTWRALARKRRLPEIYYNIAIYLDDEVGDDAAAYAWFRKYARRLPAPGRDEAAAMVARKRALFGFKP